MTERVWVAGVTGAWRDPTNWVPSGVPQPGDRLIVVSGSPTIDSGTITAETIAILGSVSLTVVSVRFAPGPNGAVNVTVTGGNDEQPNQAVIMSQGTTSFDGSIFVEANGGGGLTIDSGANFIIAEQGFLLVSQASLLAFTGNTFTNDGIVHIEGAATIDEGVAFVGKGTVELDAGGRLDIDGAVGSGQAIAFEDGTAKLTIEDVADFDGRLLFTQSAGARVVLEDIRAKSADLEEGSLTLYSGKKLSGEIEATLAVGSINPAGLAAPGAGGSTLNAKDFKLKGDGDGGTVITYAPLGPTMLEASLPVPIVAPLKATVPLKSIFKSAFGTRNPDFHGITLLPATKADASDPAQAYWGQPSVNGIEGVESGWIVNGDVITRPTVIKKGDKVSFLSGNSISSPPQIQAQVTPKKKGEKAAFVTYDVWAIDPAVADLIPATPGRPTPTDMLSSAAAFQTIYGTVPNSNLCNWIADNVAAATGATMPLPNADLDPATNVAGGFWQIAYRGSDSDRPVQDWNTLVRPGDIVRLEWATAVNDDGGGHTTTVLLPDTDGGITVYDNIDMIDGVHHIGRHDNVAYWKHTDRASITIYRLDPDQQYRIDGTSLSEFIQGSVFDDLIRGHRGSDRIKGSIGDDEIRANRAEDRVYGQKGDDLLFGGRRSDKLFGGKGDDVFAYEAIRQSKPKPLFGDVIKDFKHGDRIDLSSINLALEAKGKRPFHFVGDEPLTGRAGELNYVRSGNFLVVQGDRDGDGQADLAIKILGVGKLVDADFIL